MQAIASNGSDLFIGVGMPLEGVGIYRSTDDGLTWTKTADGPGPNTAIYAEELLVHGSTVIATRFVNTGELFYSHDSGASWQLATGIPNNSAHPGHQWPSLRHPSQLRLVDLGRSRRILDCACNAWLALWEPRPHGDFGK